MIMPELNREQWLIERRSGIGGSDASACLGMNPYKNNIDLWLEKTGRIIPEDIGHKPYVIYGKAAETPIVQLFALNHPQYLVIQNDSYHLHRHPKYPFMLATLDGSLLEIPTNRKGILEAKTTEILKSQHWEKWNNRVPDNYYIQVLHYMAVTNADFAVVSALFKTVYDDGKDVRVTIRNYHIERNDVLLDIAMMMEAEIKFWEYVKKDKEPPLILPQIHRGDDNI